MLPFIVMVVKLRRYVARMRRRKEMLNYFHF